jgi:hypothetical protein
MKTISCFSILLVGAGLSAGAFVPVNAAYNGLFYETNGYWQQSAGLLTVKSTARGNYSAKLLIGATRYSFSGRFDADGNIARDILRRGENPLRIECQVNPADPDLLEGTVSDGTWTAILIADRAVFDGKTSTSTDQGKYTMILLGDFTSTNTPGGHSYGTINIDRAGRIRFAGSLADGTKVTQSSAVSKGGQWPLYLPLHHGWGALYGWLLFNGSADEDLSGDVTWIRPEMKWEWYYPDGFAILVSAAGSRYTRPPRDAKVLDLISAEVQFNGGNLDHSITNHVTLDTRNRVANLDANGIRLTFSLSNGSFSGRVMDPITWDWIPFRGVVLQRFGIGAGYFPGWDQTGEVWIE